jgi:hypothetical protein
VARLATIGRVAAGVVVAPVAAGTLVAALNLALTHASATEALLILELVALVGIVATVMVGIPLFLLLRWRGWNGWRSYVLCGALLGAAFFGLAALTTEEGEHLPLVPALLFALPTFVGCTALGSMTFWWIVRPDRMGQRSAQGA